MTAIKINRDQRLYVIPAGNGFTCLGFDVAERKRLALWEWVGQAAPKLRRGYVKHFADYRAALAAASHHSDTLRKSGLDHRCPINLEPRLVGLEGRRVEVCEVDGEKRRFWVGRSIGWCPIHLEVSRKNSTGGRGAYLPRDATVRVVA